MKWTAYSLLLLASGLLISRAELQVKEEHEEIPERGKVTRYVLTTDAGRFAFNPPKGWSVQMKPAENSAQFVSDRLNAVFTIQFHPTPKAEKEFTASVTKRWPGAQRNEPSSCVARDAQGVARDVVYPAAGDSSLYQTRTGFLSYGRSAVEFSISAPEGNFDRAAAVWVSTLNSFSQLR